ncbi:MAG: 2-oxoacid:acceptor oxidoreductase family protein [Candidatus Bathyarchaeota archaeon]|jgi:2-oxoglutarate ferredoxin oxidoreductase subunit gamma|nr:2-oxoacid:acceptor oxidoreductase family protein [Candidatus Bathyarchaeota archaeon]
MRFEVRIGGFGGQGVITMGHILGSAASLHLRLNAVMTESYGPEARGGACKTDIVVSDVAIDYPKTTRLDCLIAMNPDAYNSYIHDVREGGVVIFDISLFEIHDKVSGIRYIGIEATKISQGLGNPQISNVVMLGALSGALDLFQMDALRSAVTERFPKASVLNLKALKAGAEAAKRAKESRRSLL